MSKSIKGICAYCHIPFVLSKKQIRKVKQGKSVYCSLECSLEKQGKTRIIISNIDCCRCGKLFKPTYNQYKRYKYNNNISESFCSTYCRYYKEYPYKIHDDYVSVFIKNNEILLDKDIFKKLKRSMNVTTSKGYKKVSIRDTINDCTISLSRWILGDKCKDKVVDHINGNTLDNRRVNLRIVTQQENMFNKKEYKNNTSEVKGVHLNKKGIWVARIQVEGKRLFLGSSKDKEKAIELRIEAEKKYFGKYDRKYLK